MKRKTLLCSATACLWAAFFAHAEAQQPSKKKTVTTQDQKKSDVPGKSTTKHPRHTILQTFDYSGPSGLAPAGIPSKTSLTIEESKELLVTAEAMDTIKAGDDVFIRYRQTYYSNNKPDLQTYVAVPIVGQVRIQESPSTGVYHIKFAYDNFPASIFGIASEAVVIMASPAKQEMARYTLETQIQDVGEEGLLTVDEKIFNPQGPIESHNKLFVSTASGRILSKTAIAGPPNLTFSFIRLWPTWKYSQGPGTLQSRQEERAK